MKNLERVSMFAALENISYIRGHEDHETKILEMDS